MMLSPAQHSTSSPNMEHQLQPGRRSASSSLSSSPFYQHIHHRSAASLADSRGLLVNPFQPPVPLVEGRRRARMQQQPQQFTSQDPYKRASLHEPLLNHRESYSPVPNRFHPSSLGGRRMHTLSTLAIPSAAVVPRDFHPVNPANSNFILRKSKSTLGQEIYTTEAETPVDYPTTSDNDEGLIEDDHFNHHQNTELSSMSIPYNCTADHTGNSSRKSSLAPSTSADLKSFSNLGSSYSSSSGCSTQSSASSSTNSFNRASKARSSLHDSAANFRDFVQQYERGLIECISSVEEEQMTNQLEASGGADRLRAHSASNGQDEQQQQRLPKTTTTTNNSRTSLMAVATEDHPSTSSPPQTPTPKTTTEEVTSTPPPLSHSLRLQLEKVRALRDQYETGYRTSEALERLMKLSKRTRDCDREYRANERALAAIEAQLEAMIGTFRIRVEELEGFARICPRDCYEIEFRHGKQRRVLRVRIGKALERTWEDGTQEVEFRGALKATVVCRLREVKSSWRLWSSRGRNVTLGVNTISMSELLVAVSRGRQIVLDANASGSLKLRIRCQWSPRLAGEESETPNSPSNKSNTLITSSFRSEHLLGTRQNHHQQNFTSTSTDLNPRKASTLTSVPPLTPIPRVNLQQRSVSPYVRNSSPQQNPSKITNLKTSADLSRSLLTLPSYYYSSNVVNPLLSAGHAEEDPQEQEESSMTNPSSSAHSLRHRSSSTVSSEVGSSRLLDYHDDRTCSSSLSSSMSSPSSTLSLGAGGENSTSSSSEFYHHQSSSHFLSSNAKQSSSNAFQTKLDRLTGELSSLQSALEDYRGQYVELTMMSITVSKLMGHLEGCATDDQLMTTEEEEESPVDEGPENGSSLVDEVETALAEFDFLEDNFESGTSLEKRTGEEEEKIKNQISNSPSSRKKSSHHHHQLSPHYLDLWTSVLSHHVASSLEQLGHVGSWILKGREAAALARLRADAFAFDLIYQQLISEGRSNALGKDRRVLELWQFASDRLTTNDVTQSSNNNRRGSFSSKSNHHHHRPYILSWRQLCQLLIDLMKELGLQGTADDQHKSEEESEDSLRYAAEWLCGLMVPLNMTKVTILDLRAFFELDLWRGGFRGGNAGQMINRRDSLRSNISHIHNLSIQPHQQQQLTLKRLFQISLDVDRLMRRSKVLSLQGLESILFDRFNVNCLWVPADVTLTMVGLLYENYSAERQSKLTTSEVKKLDRYREMGKMATNWIIWLLQDCRFEIREHVLAGLESSTAFTRRACCYGIMYMFKLMKRSTQFDAPMSAGNRRGSTSSTTYAPLPSSGVTGFFGQELDSLLYVSMEDIDGRVREEAKKALKCLGHYGQQRLHQMERSRMGFNGNVSTAAPKTSEGGGFHRRTGVQLVQAGPGAGLRCSMPNLNGI